MEALKTHCQLCSRRPSLQLPFLCPACARSVLYETRIQNAQAILSKETLAKEVEDNILDGARRWHHEQGGYKTEHAVSAGAACLQLKALEQQSQRQHDSVQEQSLFLQEEIDALRIDINKSKATVAARRKAIEHAQHEQNRREATAIDPLKSSMIQAERECTAVHNRAADVRIFLCKELASLYGLAPRKRHQSIGPQGQFLLGQMPIIDLHDLNTASPVQMTVSAGRIAHFVYLVGHYLALRMPAEITLPSPHNPYPSIAGPNSSYKEAVLAISSDRRVLASSVARPRLLHIEKSLPALVSEDPLAYSHFVEAMTLLAWNIAWIARTQGMDIGTAHWDEICGIGKNLHALFGRTHPSADKKLSATKQSTPSASSISTSKQKVAIETTSVAQDITSNPTPSITVIHAAGQLSHGSSQGFIATSSSVSGGAEWMRGWPHASPYKLIEKTKSALASERMGAEWEMLDKDEWEDQASTGLEKA